jgi:hypothetical protein
MKQYTRIEAVNRVMKIKSGERIATQSELDSLPVAADTSDELDFAVDFIQTEFEWFLNLVEEAAILADGSGNVVLPNNLAQVQFLRTDAAVQTHWLKPINGQAYDSYNQTFNLGAGKTVWYQGRNIWPFESLPLAFQMLAIAHARREIAGSGKHASPTRYAIEQKTYDNAFQTAMKFDDTLSGGRMRGPTWNRRRAPHNHGVL